MIDDRAAMIKKEKDFYDINDIINYLPHRYPFLLIDRVDDVIITEDEKNFNIKVNGLKNVTCNENFFSGHFPGNMIMPGVLIIEAMGQLSAFGSLKYYEKKNNIAINKKKYNVYFTGINEAKFKKKVVPGDQLKIYVEKLRSKMNIWHFLCRAFVDNNLVAEAKLSAALVYDL